MLQACAVMLWCMTLSPIHDTPLLRAAQARGLRTHDGLEMLVGQAREAFRRFYGAEPPINSDAELRELLIR